MPRDGTKNLIPFDKLSQDEVKKLASKGGVNSGKARRQRRLLRDTIEQYLSINTSDGKTYEDEIVLALIKSAKDGDTKAFEVIRDTIGQKPVDQIKAEIETPVFKNDLDD